MALSRIEPFKVERVSAMGKTSVRSRKIPTDGHATRTRPFL